MADHRRPFGSGRRLGRFDPAAQPQDTVAAAVDAPVVPDSPLQLGDVLLDGYGVTEIRPGGFGFVYVVVHQGSGRRFAVKTPRQRRHEDFAQEVDFWLGLSPHPNIVTAYALKEVDGHFYLFLEYVESDLRTTLEHVGRHGLPRAQALRIIHDIAMGMEHANKTGQFTHLDLKPGNILIEQDGQAKVTDFGLARRIAIRSGRYPTVSAGTWAYAAPEVFTGEAVDSRSDIFSLGVIAYELLTGTQRPLPFTLPGAPDKAFLLMRSYYESDEARQLAKDIYYGTGQIGSIIRDEETLALLSNCMGADQYDRWSSFTAVTEYMQRIFRLDQSGGEKDDTVIDRSRRAYERAAALQQMGRTVPALDIYNHLLIEVTDDPGLRAAILGNVVEALSERGQFEAASSFEAERRQLLADHETTRGDPP